MDKLMILRISCVIALVVSQARTQDFYFDPQPMDLDVIEGDNTVMRCDVSNRKNIIFRWELNGRRVANTSRRYMDDSDLRINGVDRELDKGKFTCIATNATTRIPLRSREASLNILWIANTADVELKTPKTSAEIAMNSELQLRCVCEGNPEPQVLWYRNGDRLDGSGSVRLPRNRLRIEQVSPGDNGVYACEAYNEAGSAKSRDTNFLLSVSGEGAATLNTDTFTKITLVKKGAAARFDCEYDGALLTEWYFKDRLLNNETDNGKFLVFSNGSLVINDVRSRDVGGYKCVGISETGPVQGFLSDLVLAYLSQLSSDSFEPKLPDGGPVVIPVGGSYQVRCKAPQGLPAPALRWEDPQGQELPSEGNIRAESDTLFLEEVQQSDSGNYSCVVHNMADTQRKSVWIMVSVAPQLMNSLISERVHEGEQVTFHCEYLGTPYPVTEVTWRKENQPLDRNNPRYGINRAEGLLTISNIQQSDEGNYACVVSTEGHDPVISLNAHLYVKKMLKFKPEPIDTKLELGSSARIYCRADGEASPSVYWLKNGSNDLGHGVVDSDGTLEFEQVTYSHAGVYTCEARSDQGSISKSINVTVVVKPWFKVMPKNMTGHEGHITMIHCVAEGDPKPLIRWDKNGEVEAIDGNERFQTFSNGSLSITETYIEDIGKYGCTAGSSAGFIRAEMYLAVTHEPPNVRTKEKERFDMMKTIIIAVCAAVAYLAVVIGLTVYCSIRLVKMKAAKNKRNTAEDAAPTANGRVENGHVPNERTELMENGPDRDMSVIKPVFSDDTRSHASAVSSHNSSHPSSSMRSASTYHKYNFPRNKLETLGLLGKGQYGDVFLGKAHHIRNGEPETLVVVKALMSRDERHQFEFRRDLDMLSRVDHEYIVQLVGVCREVEPQFIITEYPEWGDLKQFLWAMRKDTGLSLKVEPITDAQKLTMCNQVAQGMEHMANHRLVHKDLASRNILLQPNLDIKISNLGLCRDVYANEYYPLHHNYLIPLRWMSPETVYTPEEFSTKSDVWAFGCFIFEVFSLGDIPHMHKSDEEVLNGLKTGDCVLDEIPTGCPPEMWDLVQRCTTDSVCDRPSFSEICVCLGEMTADSDV